MIKTLYLFWFYNLHQRCIITDLDLSGFQIFPKIESKNYKENWFVYTLI